MLPNVLIWIIDFLVLLGALILSLGVLGIYRFPCVYASLHASSMAFIMGTIVILIAILFTGIPDLVDRTLLIAAFLLLTSPVSSHVIAMAAYTINEPQKAKGAVDETGRTAPKP